MTELAMIFKEFTPGAYGIWVGVLMFAGWWLKEWRETRKLSLDDRIARREGYEKQVAGLLAENRALRDEMAKDRKAHDDYRALCHKENDALRDLVIRLEGEVAGFKRRADSLSRQVSRIDGPPDGA